MPPRKFGIEYETCLNLPERFDIYKPPSFDEQVGPYLVFLHERFPSLPEPVKAWCATFENSVFIYTVRNNFLYNFATGKMEDTNVPKSRLWKYDKPILIRDVSVICHANFDKLYEGDESKRNESRREYGVNNVGRFTTSVEFVTQMLSSFEEWEYFKKAIMPPDEFILRNKSQGIHLNIGVEDLTITEIREILLMKYAPWESEHASLVRPYPSGYAQVLEDKNLMNLIKTKRLFFNKTRNIYSNEKMREAVNGILYKEKSIHLKPKGVLEIRIFSPLGENIEEAMKEVYSFFPPVAEVGGSHKLTRKKLKRVNRKKTRQTK